MWRLVATSTLCLKKIKSIIFLSMSNHPSHNPILKNTVGWIDLQSKSLVTWWTDKRLTDNLGTCKTFFSGRQGNKVTIPWPTTVVKEPSAFFIFLITRTRIIGDKWLRRICHMINCSQVYDPRIIMECVWGTKGIRSRKLTWLCKWTQSICFSRELRRFLNLSISSLLNSPVFELLKLEFS